MKQRFNKLTHELCVEAVLSCFDKKWNRSEILEFIEQYGGVSRKEIFADYYYQRMTARNEAAENCALYLEEIVDSIMHGRIPEEIQPVAVRKRADGMTGKIRDIACLCMQHQLIGHLVKLGLDPLLHARLLPTQHASIPGHGQTRLKTQVGYYLRRKKLNIRCFQKTDIHHAYESTKYSAIVGILKKEIPRAKWIITLMEYIETIAPEGHLIIGGYLDAWMFNFVMSYAIRYTLDQHTYRRGTRNHYAVRIETYMDDFAIFGRTKSNVKKAIRCLRKYLKETFGMELNVTTKIITLNTIRLERARRKQKRPSKRGNPSLDMGGYQIHLSYVTMRPRVVKRVRRTFLRAYRELLETGTIRTRRSKTLSARYGFVVQTTSKYFRQKYHVDEVMTTARKVNAYLDRRNDQKKKEWLRNVISQDSVYDRAFCGHCRKSA